MNLDKIYKEFRGELKKAIASRPSPEVRVGAELKFPLVRHDGRAAALDQVQLLWDHLESRGWEKETDPVNGSVTGCSKAGKQNRAVASTETGFAKTEFSLAHESNLFEIQKALALLSDELKEFQDAEGLFFLCHGIHPVSRPCRDLMVKKSRTGVWDKIFKSNNHIPEKDGDDMHLFTVNAASHVHVSVPEEGMVRLVNVLNGFSAAQIALTAHSRVWKGSIDREYMCAAETFWDRWIPEPGRVGVPEKPFADLKDYVRTVSCFKPVYVERGGVPVLLPGYETFLQYYTGGPAEGLTLDGKKVMVEPSPGDLKIHNTLYWFNARISGYYTVENRLCDQQPEDSLLAPSALTLGLCFSSEEAWEELRSYSWESLRNARREACESGAGCGLVCGLAEKMLGCAENGLKKRALGEEEFLRPLTERLKARKSPADETEEIFKSGGINGLIGLRKLKGTKK